MVALSYCSVCTSHFFSADRKAQMSKNKLEEKNMEKITQELKIVEIRDFTKFVKKKKSDEGENKEFRIVKT